MLADEEPNKDFVESLLEDFNFLIKQKRLNFIYSLIVPILTIDNTIFKPLCLHRSYELNEINSKFLPILKKIEEKGANANKLLSDGKIQTEIFDENERDKF